MENISEVVVKVQRVSDGLRLELSVPGNCTLQTLSTRISSETGEEGPHRFVLRGRICALWRSIHDLEIQQDETLFYMRDLPRPPERLPPAGGGPMPIADPMRDMMNNPFMQVLLDNPDIMMTIMDSNPQIRAMRERRPELNALFSDPQTMRDVFQTMRNPAMAREMLRTTDRAMRNIDAMPGGFDALRQLYHDVHEPMWDSLSGAEAPTSDDTSVRDYQPASGEGDQPFPQAWPAPQEETPAAPPSGLPWLSFPPSGVTQFLPSPTQPVRARYQGQLHALRDMGFEDESSCLAALERHGGNVNQAIDDLLQQSLGNGTQS